jgi:hypothetical protein
MITNEYIRREQTMKNYDIKAIALFKDQKLGTFEEIVQANSEEHARTIAFNLLQDKYPLTSAVEYPRCIEC